MDLSFDKIKGALDEVRAQVAPRNDTERRVYEALSSKNWGASTTLMNQIAQDTYDYERYGMIMKLVWQHMDGPGRSWKQIFKALTLLDHLVKNGAERIVEEARDHMHKIRTMTDFNHYEGNVDKGAGVREKAKALLELLSSNESIRSEREKARSLRDKFVGIGSSSSGYGGYGGYSNNSAGSGLGGPSYSGRYDGFGSESRRDDFSRSSHHGGASSSRPNRYSDAASPSGEHGHGHGYSDRDDRDHRQYSGSSRYDHDDDRQEGSVVSEDSEPVKPKSRPKARVKKTETPKKVQTPTPTKPAPDLIGESFFGEEPAPAATSQSFDAFGLSTGNTAANAASFDAFGTGFAAPSAPQNGATGFGADPFATPVFPPQQPASQPVQFDAFGTGAATTQPTGFAQGFGQPMPQGNGQQMPNAGFGMQPMANTGFGGQPMATQGFGVQPTQPAMPNAGMGAQPMVQAAGFSQPTPAPGAFANTVLTAQSAAYGAMGAAAQQAILGPSAGAGHVVTPMSGQPQPRQPDPAFGSQNGAQTAATHADGDFGEFQSQPAEAPATPAKPNKWATLGGLVDLNSLSTDKELKAAQQAADSTPKYDEHQSFHGLDGFARGSQTTAVGRPGVSTAGMGMGMGMNRPMQGSAMGGPPQQPVMGGMMMPQPMGAPSMQQPMGGMNMGMGMGMQPAMGMSMQPHMGGMQPSMGMQPGMNMGGGMQPQLGGMSMGMPMQPQMGQGMMGGMGMAQPMMGGQGYGAPSMGGQPGMAAYPNYGMGGNRGF